MTNDSIVGTAFTASKKGRDCGSTQIRPESKNQQTASHMGQ